ncbi:hypothetical protein PHLCEN_2v3383 [Hermanssonia centrifuga]|uniref:Uncharacterized protein n=1 Tax=Hermanssonia centrifuga TaxID=98765 RepID=A0A2R6QIQ6_9APHY|nr:hypothetical protein PHLCEN_2v3383 [Hermanssonia centrifuga]
MTHIRRQEMGSVTLDQVVGKRREKPNRDRHGKGLDYCVVEVIRRMRNKGERPGCALQSENGHVVRNDNDKI